MELEPVLHCAHRNTAWAISVVLVTVYVDGKISSKIITTLECVSFPIKYSYPVSPTMVRFSVYVMLWPLDKPSSNTVSTVHGLGPRLLLNFTAVTFSV